MAWDKIKIQRDNGEFVEEQGIFLVYNEFVISNLQYGSSLYNKKDYKRLWKDYYLRFEIV